MCGCKWIPILAAFLLSEGVQPIYVMEQAGHSSIDVTVREYGAWIPKADRSLIDRLDGRLAPARAALLVAAGGGEPSPAPDDAGRLNSSQPDESTPAAVIEMSGFVEDSWSRRADLNRGPADYESA